MIAPLSKAALGVLADSTRWRIPCRDINAGIVRKLTTEGWCDLVWMPDPKHGARDIQALIATTKGIARTAFEQQQKTEHQ